MTDCPRVADMLPWLVNGTLDEGERARVVEHLRTCADCREELDRIRTVLDTSEGHPPSGLLAAWAMGETVPDAEIIADHVASCPDCTRDAALVGENEVLAAFVPPSRSRDRDTARVLWRRTTATAAAALIVGVVIGALIQQPSSTNRHPDGERVAELERRLDRTVARLESFLRPRANVPVIELLPDSLDLRAPGRTIHVPDEASVLTLILAPNQAFDGTYRLRIVTETGDEVAAMDGLRAGRDGDLTLSIPADALPRGIPLTILLHAEGRSVAADTYHVFIALDPEPPTEH